MRGVIISEELRSTIRSVRMVFVVLILAFLLFSVYASGFLQVAYLLLFKPSSAVPFPLSITYYLLFALLPLMGMLLSHDSVSREVESGQMKGVVSKVSRKKVIIEKSIALWIMLSAFSAIALGCAFLYSWLRLDAFAITHALTFLLVLIFFSAAWSATVISISAITKNGLLLIIALNFMLLSFQESKASLLHHIHAPFFDTTSAILAFIIYTAVFLALGIFCFEGRDL